MSYAFHLADGRSWEDLRKENESLLGTIFGLKAENRRLRNPLQELISFSFEDYPERNQLYLKVRDIRIAARAALEL